MKEIVEAQKKWRRAKVLASASCIRQGKRDVAEKLNVCNMFKGTESMEEMIPLMFSAQGAEFLTTYGFPDIETFRMFKKYHPERFGVYIDCGKINLSGVQRAFLVGNTQAEIKCDETALYRIILMHGASAEIEASGYSVVKIEKDGVSEVKGSFSGMAKRL